MQQTPTGSGAGGRVCALLAWRPLAELGVASYGIFLWHFDWIEQLGDFVTARGYRGFVVPVVLAVPLALSCATARRLHVLAA